MSGSKRLRSSSDSPSAVSKRRKKGEEGEEDEGENVDKNENKLLQVKNILDDVHGHITLPALLFTFIDTAEFQRLRNLKQLGGCYFVYPGASHNRFEHCIGVAYLSGLVVEHLQKKQPELKITKEDVVCIQIAGLCHDLGHGPFSHVFEHVANKEFCHEEISCNILDDLLKRNEIHLEEYNLDPVKDLDFIKECIRGEKGPIMENGVLVRKGRDRSKWYLYDIVSNIHSGLDMDKIDYFLRDSKNTGVVFGCNVQRLISESRVVDVEGRLQIAYPEKLVHEILSLFHTRFLLHLTVYQHKVVKAIEFMITDALDLAEKGKVFTFRSEDGKKFTLKNCFTNTYAFLQAQDDVLQQIERSTSNNENAKAARELVKRIRKRDLYISVGEVAVPVQSSSISPAFGCSSSPSTGYSSSSTSTFTMVERSPKTPTKQSSASSLANLYAMDNDDIVKELLSTRAAEAAKGKLRETDIKVEKIEIHWGTHERNPMDLILFFPKNDAEAKRISHEQYETPRSFRKDAIRVFAKNKDFADVVGEAFDELVQKYPDAATPIQSSAKKRPRKEGMEGRKNSATKSLKFSKSEL
jgi:HD superfamily phosphohydrolase